MSGPAVRQHPRTDYSVIFAILALFTAMEVGVGYLPSLPDGVRVGVLVFLAAVKVALVLLYFMHLKFDNRVFALPFALGLVLVVPLVLIVGLTTPESSAPPGNEQQASQSSGPSGAQTITVTETTFKISLSADSVPAGQVTFHVANDATDLPHQLTIIKTDQPAGQLPVSQGEADESQLDVVGKTDSIPTSGKADLTLNLSPGHYALVCNVPGHYQAGMYADLTVTGGGGSESGAGPTATPAPTTATTGTPETTPAPTTGATGTPEMTATPSGQPTAEATQAAGTTTVTVAETTFGLKPSPDTIPAGTITFHVVNQATDIPHQLAVIRTDAAAAQLPVDSQDDPLMSQLDVVGQTDNIAPGQSADLTLNLSAGHYALICALHGHYHAGMYADFTVR